MHRPALSGTAKLGLLSTLMVAIGLKPIDLSDGRWRPGKHNRTRRRRGIRERTTHLRKVCSSKNGTSVPVGKLNFRRSNPRHPMYDALLERGWEISTDGPAEIGGPFINASRKNKKGEITDVCPPHVAFASEHDKDPSLRVPMCMRGAA